MNRERALGRMPGNRQPAISRCEQPALRDREGTNCHAGVEHGVAHDEEMLQASIGRTEKRGQPAAAHRGWGRFHMKHHALRVETNAFPPLAYTGMFGGMSMMLP